jgi:hypothetical protein
MLGNSRRDALKLLGLFAGALFHPFDRAKAGTRRDASGPEDPILSVTPKLKLTSSVYDPSPEFDLSVANLDITGYVLNTQRQVSGAGWISPSNSRHVISDAEERLNRVALAMPPLAAGVYDERCWLSKNEDIGPLSNVVTFTTKVWTPSAISPDWWAEARSSTNRIAFDGTGAAPSASADVVGYLADLSGHGLVFTTLANDSCRPLFVPGAHPAVRFDGSDDVLIGSYALDLFNSASGFTIAFALKGNSPTPGAYFFAEANTATSGVLGVIASDRSIATKASAFYRPDSGSGVVGPAAANPAVPNVFDGNPHIYIVTDDGTTMRTYLDGVTSLTTATNRSLALTVNKIALGALVRGNHSNHIPVDFFFGLAKKSVVSADSLVRLAIYGGALVGLEL